VEVAIKGLVIAGTKSGSGKTTIALGFMAALADRGLRLAPFKVGPDFIDPGHHSRITGVISRNLDGWMLSKSINRQCFFQNARRADIAVVEGVMGLFDGYDGRSEAGSTAQMAKWLSLPVILVVDARSMARSAAALVQGFENFDRQVVYAGVLFNNIGSRRHLRYLQEALEGQVRMPCLGGIVRRDEISIPERHLGLVTQQDFALSHESITRLATLIEASIDLDSLLNDLAQCPIDKTFSEPEGPDSATAIKIGVARDNAFCFYYQDNLDLLAIAGAQVVEFSPMNDTSLPPDLDGIYLGGGYPELFARQLSANTAMRRQIRKQSEAGMPIYGECGGFMYLGRQISDLEGRPFPMTGCFPVETRMLSRLKALGYRQIELTRDSILGGAGDVIRGHEFHYSELSQISNPVDTVYRVTPRAGNQAQPEGYRINNTLGSYIHLHFGSCHAAATHFVDSCRRYRRERKNVK
jgi:cobyrinic acid a,c-diamide synthase